MTLGCVELTVNANEDRCVLLLQKEFLLIRRTGNSYSTEEKPEQAPEGCATADSEMLFPPLGATGW